MAQRPERPLSGDNEYGLESALFAEKLEEDFGSALHQEDRQAYQSLSLCVIDAVFSIQARYTGVKNVVKRYCQTYRLQKMYRPDRRVLPPREEQDCITDLLREINRLGSARFASEVLKNRARTSARSGILKAEAVRLFASTLAKHGVLYLQDVPICLANPGVEETVRSIPGQRSGITFRYMLMEAGCDDLVKPDTMVLRYLRQALGRTVQTGECQSLLSGAAALLRRRFPNVTPRSLDKLIWERQSAAARKPSQGCRRRPFRSRVGGS